MTTTKFSTLFFAAMTALALTACGGGGGGSSSATDPNLAATPLSYCNANVPGQIPTQASAYGTSCSSPIYGQNGYLPYGTVGNGLYGSNGFCGCPAGYRPIGNSGWGMGCAPMTVFGGGVGYGGGYMGWNFGGYINSGYGYGQNIQYNNIPQINSISLTPSGYSGYSGGYYGSPYSSGLGYGGGGGNCFSDVGMACQPGVIGSCGPYGVCVATGGYYGVGVCQSQSGFPR